MGSKREQLEAQLKECKEATDTLAERIGNASCTPGSGQALWNAVVPLLKSHLEKLVANGTPMPADVPALVLRKAMEQAFGADVYTLIEKL